jgi:serine/threonine-protein kinase
MTAPGRLLAGRYRVVRHLGSGGMAAVYLAEDEALERKVAVKRLHAPPESETGRRIAREARLGAALNHPGLVTVYDTLADEDALLLVMEYVPGETLADAIARGPLAAEDAVRVLRPVAEALDHAHAAGVVHRDVKPANVLLHERGAVKLADLGVATSEDVTRITRTGGLVGTLAYVAPEQLHPGPVTAAADVYALAAVAFEALTGRRVRPGANTMQLLQAAAQDPPDLREALPGAPEAAADVLRRGLAPDPDERPFTAVALVDELAAAFAVGAPEPEEPEPAPDATAELPRVEPRPARPGPPLRPAAPARRPAAPRPAPPPEAPFRPFRRRWRVVVGLALAAVAAGALVAVLAASGDDEPPPRAETAPARRTAPRTATTQATAPRTDTTPAPPAGAPRTPREAVVAVYTRAAADDFDGAWAAAGPGFRARFGNSQATFEGTLGTLESIAFPRLEEIRRSGDTATVAVETVARHTDRVDRCAGTFQAVRRDGAWLAGDFSVSCR